MKDAKIAILANDVPAVIFALTQTARREDANGSPAVATRLREYANIIAGAAKED